MKLSTHTYYVTPMTQMVSMATTNNKQPQAVFIKITSSLLKLANYGAQEMKLCAHVYFRQQKCPQALFPITTSSLLKLANHVMHGHETRYAYVFQCFHDDNEQKMAWALFPITTSSLLKLANHSGEICTQVYLGVSMMSSSLRHSISIHIIGIL